MRSDVFELPSFAKVNLSLRVLGKRDDDLHEVFTEMQSISLHDTLQFDASRNGIVLTCDDHEMPVDDSNIIVRAGEKLRRRSGNGLGAIIHLQKRIPSPGGLGGGSSNAAVTLLALNRLWEINASIAELGSIATELGADVPFFLYGGTAVGTGSGATVEPIDDWPDSPMIVVTPNVQVPTAFAYSLLGAPTLTNIQLDSTLTNYRSGVVSGYELVNDLEKMVFAEFPEIDRVKNTLIELGANMALMSGSGASVFGIFDNEETRQTALKALGERTNWRSFAVAAISRSDYREALAEVF